MFYPKPVFVFESGGTRERLLHGKDWYYFQLSAFALDREGSGLPAADPPWNYLGQLPANYDLRYHFHLERVRDDLDKLGWAVSERFIANTKDRMAAEYPEPGYPMVTGLTEAADELLRDLLREPIKP
jgi:hypothetical protein